MANRGKRFARGLLIALLVYGVLSALAGVALLPSLLFYPPLPRRDPGYRERVSALFTSGKPATKVKSADGVELDVLWKPDPEAKVTMVVLHGFGDDALGPLSGLYGLPNVNLVGFTFRGRDHQPATPCTLGAWEKLDVVAVVHFLESRGVPRSRIVLKGASQGAGVALLALEQLENEGVPLGGALLESPYRDLRTAARSFVRGVLGPATFVSYPAIEIGLWWAGRRAHFDPESVSPLVASQGRRTPLALVSGDADTVTPIEGVRDIAKNVPDYVEITGAEHMQAASALPGGERDWVTQHLRQWGLLVAR